MNAENTTEPQMTDDEVGRFYLGLSCLRLEVPEAVWDDFNQRAGAVLTRLASTEELRDELVGALREIHETLSNAYGHADAQHEPPALHALNLATEALDWVDSPAEPIGD